MILVKEWWIKNSLLIFAESSTLTSGKSSDGGGDSSSKEKSSTPTPSATPSPAAPSSQTGQWETPVSGAGTTTPSTQTNATMSAPPVRQVAKRRMRRRANSQCQDPAEQLTEMSVRGLNLFRYASISEGVYQCTECAKLDIQKTFKNKYSFQRHAFLYHEGHQRKVFPCPVCGKEFSRPDKMKNHMKTVHDCFMPKDCVMPFGFYLQP